MAILFKIDGVYQYAAGVYVKIEGVYQSAHVFFKDSGEYAHMLLSDEARRICSRMSFLGAPPSAARAALIETTVSALKTAGLFALLGDLRIFAAHSATAAQVNWITPADDPAVFVNSPEMTVDEGLRTDGITSFISLGRTPNSIPGYAQNDASIGLYVRESGTAQNTALGATSGRVALIQPRTSSGNYVGRLNSAASVTFGPVSTRSGLFTLSRQSSDSVCGYKDGALVSTQSSTSSATAQTTNINIGLDSGAYADDQYSAVFVGRGLSPQHVADLHSILSGYMSAVGA